MKRNKYTEIAFNSTIMRLTIVILFVNTYYNVLLYLGMSRARPTN